MASSSTTSSSSSNNLMIGSFPRTYLIVKPGYLYNSFMISFNKRIGMDWNIEKMIIKHIIYLWTRSLLIKACTWGYAPKRHPHTSRMAFGYFDSLDSNVLPSSVQQSLQLFVITCLSFMSNLWISSQEEQSNVGVWKPRVRHSSRLWRATDSITNWVSSANKAAGFIFVQQDHQFWLVSKVLRARATMCLSRIKNWKK